MDHGRRVRAALRVVQPRPGMRPARSGMSRGLAARIGSGVLPRLRCLGRYTALLPYAGARAAREPIIRAGLSGPGRPHLRTTKVGKLTEVVSTAGTGSAIWD